MKVVVTGAGSGGHITPILAVAHELKQLNSNTTIIYIGQVGDSLIDIPKQHSAIDEVYAIPAGKFRRYHKAGIAQLFDVQTLLKNIRDAWRTFRGIILSYHLLGQIRPDVIFIKGGYIGVPVGLSAVVRHIPYITHDSDAIPGLANRIIARWAKVHATALPKENYNYPPEKTEVIGVPVSSLYQYVTKQQQQRFREVLNLDKYEHIILITGGGLGAQRLNEYVINASPILLKKYPNLVLVHLSGRANLESTQKMYDDILDFRERGRVVVKDFITDLHLYSGAADLIITRAGATNLAEFSIQGKACIVVPNGQLVGGHQLKNAVVLANAHAIELLYEGKIENDDSVLTNMVSNLLESTKLREELGNNFNKFSHINAARELSALIIKVATNK